MDTNLGTSGDTSSGLGESVTGSTGQDIEAASRGA